MEKLNVKNEKKNVNVMKTNWDETSLTTPDCFLLLFYLYIYPNDLQESDGGANI